MGVSVDMRGKHEGEGARWGCRARVQGRGAV